MKKEIIIISFCSGLLFFCYYYDLILITTPFKHSMSSLSDLEKKNVPLFYFKNNNWHQESSSLLWPKSTLQQAQALISHWFLIGEQEEFLPHKVSVIHCALSHTKTTLFITLDRSPFEAIDPLRQKIILIESMLKTIRENKLKISYLYIFVNNKFLEDQHLNFINPLSVNDFCSLN